MLIALLAALATYIYLQWPIFVGMSIIIAAIMWIITAIMAIYIADNPRAADIEEMRPRRSKFVKWAIACSIFAVIIPPQKTLGTAVAVGAAAYATNAVITSDVVQKFLLLVNKEANNLMDDRLKDLQNKTEPAKPEPAK